MNYSTKSHTYGEKNSGTVMTIPDKTISIKEMMRRIEAGIPLGGHMGRNKEENAYYNDELLPNLKKMDLVEIDELGRSLSEELKQGQEKLSTIKKIQYEREIEERGANRARMADREKPETIDDGGSV